MTVLILCIVFATVSALAIFALLMQQRTIDRLTDKLMARDYREYRSMNNHPLMQEEKPTRKAMSFYDDPNIEDDIAG